jgi:hypothetical protein
VLWCIGFLAQHLGGFDEGGGGEPIVAIDDGDKFALGEAKGGVEGVAATLVFGGDATDAVVFLGVGLGEVGGAVAGAIVPEDEFEVG